MNWMTVREFLRGGYQDIREPTVISNHGRPVFTVFPHDGWNSSTAKMVASLNMRDTSSMWNSTDPLTYSSRTTSTTVRSDLPDDNDL